MNELNLRVEDYLSPVIESSYENINLEEVVVGGFHCTPEERA